MTLWDVSLTLAAFAFGLSSMVLLSAFINWKSRHVRNYTEAARIICKAAFGQELPSRFIVLVSDSPKGKTQMERKLGGTYVLGTCDEFLKVIELSRNRLAYCDASEWRTLVHECLHALQPGRKHETNQERREFELIVNHAMDNLWEEVNSAELRT